MSNTLIGRGSKDMGLDNNSLRPVVYDGDVKKYTIYGAVVSVMLNSDGTYNSDYIYDILITLADKNIIPHISIDDSDEDGTKYTVLYASVDDGEVLLSYIKLDQEKNGSIYNVVLKADGTYTINEYKKFVSLHYLIVSELPETGDDNILYLLGPTGDGGDKYEEYIYDSTKNPAWVKIGDTSIDLSGYAKSEDIPVEKGIGANSVQQKGSGATANGNMSVAEGAETFAGQKGYKYTNTGSVTNQLTLTSVDGLAVGDIVSIVNDKKYGDCSTITAISGKVVTFDSLPFTEIVSRLIDFDDYVLYVSAKPTVGDVDLALSAHTEGDGSSAQNWAAHAEGRDTKALGEYSHAEGRETIAQYASHAEGRKTEAIGTYSHAEGFLTHSTNEATHTEGKDNTASAKFAHSEGYLNTASGEASHAEGGNGSAIGNSSHKEGNKSIAYSKNSHAEGEGTIAGDANNPNTSGKGQAAHAEGYQTKAIGNYSHAEGAITTASGNNSHSEGVRTTASGSGAHAEGTSTNVYDGSTTIDPKATYTLASGGYSHAEGGNTKATASAAHAEGNLSLASGLYSHAENQQTRATATAAHAEGVRTMALGVASHAEGTDTVASDSNSHAEGLLTGSSAKASHAEGNHTEASGEGAHAEGIQTKASAKGSHAEGNFTTASGPISHAEGSMSVANGNISHVEGLLTKTENIAEHAEGRYNVSNKGSDDFGNYGNTSFSHGIGTAENDRKNAFEIMENGEIYIIGVGGYDGTNPTTKVNSLQKVLEGLGITIDWNIL